MAKKPALPELDPDHKRTKWETVIITTPVILTVMATVLAGMSSSEMSTAQYFRSLAAQMQSKVSDQWGYFQAKKLRAEQCDNTAAILRGISQSMPADPRTPTQIISQLNRAMLDVTVRLAISTHSTSSGLALGTELDGHQKAASALSAKIDYSGISSRSIMSPGGMGGLAGFVRGDVPEILKQPIRDPKITDAISAVDSHVDEAVLERQAGQLSDNEIDDAIAIANQNAAAFDKAADQTTAARVPIAQACAGISREGAEFERAARTAPAEVAANVPAGTLDSIHGLAMQLSTMVSVADLNFNANRYQREAHDNQVLADLLELQVRRQSFLSERHRIRSKEFFYGMLGAQAGVTIATFSLAVRRRNLLWGLAASAGLAAVTFAAYVYMFV